MKKRNPGSGVLHKGKKLVFIWFVLMINHSVVALPALDELGQEQVSVRELMLLDTQRALKNARNSTSENPLLNQRVNRVERSMSTELQLVAIYGVGTQLMAEVVSDQNVYLYRHGQALPVGVAPGDDVYMLSTISVSCVELSRSDSSHRLCLHPSQWERKQ